MSTYRPRRTRLYGASYNIGESYYKKQLDSLDHKRGSSRFSDPQYPSTILGRDNKSQPRSVSFMNSRDDAADDFRMPIRAMSQRPVIEEPDDDLDMRFRARRFVRKVEANDDEFDDIKTSDLLKKSQNLISKNRSSFLDDLDEQANEGFVSRRWKMRSENVIVDNTESSAAVAASSRAKATKARLLDLENEMLSLNSKQTEREKRNRNLKQLLSEAESTDTYKALQHVEF